MSTKAWDRVVLARRADRPKAMDIIPRLFASFYSLAGDRHFGEDKALLAGLGFFEGVPVTILAQSKGRNLEENMQCNFGMLHPEGYRKAHRLALQAEKFNRPIITIIDTAGAYPGEKAEERGQAEAIAANLKLFSTLKVPVIAIVLSEGGSGGALALGVADRVYMMENAIYSILSPEGFASILWKDDSRTEEAAELMECTAEDLLDKRIIDAIIPESSIGFEQDLNYSLEIIRNFIRKDLKYLKKLSAKKRNDLRYKKYRVMGKRL